MTDAAVHRAAAAVELAEAAALGCGRSRHALRVLQGYARAGRRATDDEAALREIARLEAAGQGKHAISIVARAIGGSANTPRRLRAKREKMRGKLKFALGLRVNYQGATHSRRMRWRGLHCRTSGQCPRNGHSHCNASN